MALPYDERPVDDRPIHTDELPATPTRDRNIVASAWIEAPHELVEMGQPFGHEQVDFKRRIGRWLLWRAGPATKADAVYMALAADDLNDRWTFRLLPDGTGDGEGPSGTRHAAFRSWKEDLHDHGGS